MLLRWIGTKKGPVGLVCSWFSGCKARSCLTHVKVNSCVQTVAVPVLVCTGSPIQGFWRNGFTGVGTAV